MSVRWRGEGLRCSAWHIDADVLSFMFLRSLCGAVGGAAGQSAGRDLVGAGAGVM